MGFDEYFGYDLIQRKTLKRLLDENSAADAIPAATTTVNGTVKKAATVAAITPAADGTTAGTAVNAILTALKNAGIMA